MKKFDLSYILNELGEERKKYFGSVSPPIIQTSNFAFPNIQTLRKSLHSELNNYFYTRGNNPTVEILRKKVAALEHAEDALIFSSGVAAIAAAVMSHIKSGEHVVCVRNPYSWTYKLLASYLPRFGVSATFVDGRDAKNFERAIQRNTKIFYLETPNSFVFDLQDISAVVKIAKKHGVTTICDNSYSSPIFQNPIDYGVDMVVHSATKYLSGHSDIVAGTLCTTRKKIERIFETEFMTIGACISPHDAWLMIKGLRTLRIRLEHAAKGTSQVVKYLEKHPKVENIIWPFLPSHPQYKLAKKQMRHGAGLFNVTFKTKSLRKMDNFCNSLKRFLLACSWGGYESLFYPVSAMIESQNYQSEKPLSMVRFYVGLDEPEVLIEDLEQALKKL